MKLTQLSLKNYRCFDRITIGLDEHLTVLVAPNGQGKSAILDAIRIALWPYVSAFDVVSGTQAGTGIEIDDVTMRPTGTAVPPNMEPQLPSVISATATIDGRQVVWSRSRDKVSRGSKTTARDAKALSEVGAAYQRQIRGQSEHGKADDNSDLSLPVIAYYGTGRLWKQRKPRLQRKQRSGFFSRTFAYHGCLESASDYSAFVDWFFFDFAADFEQRTKTLERHGIRAVFDVTSHGQILEAVSASVDRMTAGSGWAGLRYSPSNQALVMSHPEFGELKVDQLSDGQRNMIAMAGDIAYRCVKLNPGLGARATLDTDGIVLIDEIDMHLHPQWQQIVVRNLREAFPKIQFIVTTHSPQVLTSIHKEHIRTLGRNAAGAYVASEPIAASYGEISSDVLESIMLVDPQPPIAERADLRRLVELVDQGQYGSDEAKQLLQGLQDRLRRNHPQLQRIERSIQRQEALKG